MQRIEALEEYNRAQRLGMRDYREKTAAGKYPYLPALDELLEKGGRNLAEKAGEIEGKSVHDFALLGNPGTGILTEKMQDIIDIYNHTESICFDSERIYLIETSA